MGVRNFHLNLLRIPSYSTHLPPNSELLIKYFYKLLLITITITFSNSIKFEKLHLKLTYEYKLNLKCTL